MRNDKILALLSTGECLWFSNWTIRHAIFHTTSNWSNVGIVLYRMQREMQAAERQLRIWSYHDFISVNEMNRMTNDSANIKRYVDSVERCGGAASHLHDVFLWTHINKIPSMTLALPG